MNDHRTPINGRVENDAPEPGAGGPVVLDQIIPNLTHILKKSAGQVTPLQIVPAQAHLRNDPVGAVGRRPGAETQTAAARVRRTPPDTGMRQGLKSGDPVGPVGRHQGADSQRDGKDRKDLRPTHDSGANLQAHPRSGSIPHHLTTANYSPTRQPPRPGTPTPSRKLC